MKYYTIPPPQQLKPYVRFFWVLEHDFTPAEKSYTYRSIADGCTEMVFHYRSAFNQITDNATGNSGPSGIQFQTTQYRRFITHSSFGIFGAYIYPFAVPMFFNIPAQATSNLALDFDTFLGCQGRELEEKIMLATDNYKRAAILSEFLIRRLDHKSDQEITIITAIKQVIHTKQPATVAQLANQFNLSTRQFHRKFKAYAGFNPKLYLRLMRLKDAVELYGSNKSLTQIAYECGYYDQSHFIHDCKTFTGYHPGFYFSGKAEGTEYRNL